MRAQRTTPRSSCSLTAKNRSRVRALWHLRMTKKSQKNSLHRKAKKRSRVRQKSRNTKLQQLTVIQIEWIRQLRAKCWFMTHVVRFGWTIARWRSWIWSLRAKLPISRSLSNALTATLTCFGSSGSGTLSSFLSKSYNRQSLVWRASHTASALSSMVLSTRYQTETKKSAFIRISWTLLGVEATQTRK